MQCRGCDYVFVEKASSSSEDWYYETGADGERYPEVVESISYWPALSKRKKPDWMTDGGIDAPNVDKLDVAMLELYGALNNDLNVLAGIAIRTCFDVASELLNVDPAATFKEKLDDLVEKGHIGVKDRERIETLVDAGSASAHRGWRPRSQDLSVMTEILEHFVHDAFVAPSRKAKLDAQASKMKENVPQKQQRKPKSRQMPTGED